MKRFYAYPPPPQTGVSATVDLSKSEKCPDSDDWHIPTDIRAFLEPLLLLVCFVAAMQQHAAAFAGGDTSLFGFALMASVVGAVLLFFARWPLYRQGKVFAFGPRHLDRFHRRLYCLAYVFIVPSILFMAFLTILLRS